MVLLITFPFIWTIASAFPFVQDLPGVDSSLLRRQQTTEGPGSEANCPFNPDHKPAFGINEKFPYNGAKDGLPGLAKGGYSVPAPGDPDHQFIAPDYTKDIRGPCPGLNVAANYGFLARDGIVTFNELIDAQQNMYNVDWPLAIFLATVGLTLGDGDVVSQRLSIGCDATGRTSFNRLLTGAEPGLQGHNKFEADSSLTRNDYYTAGGENFRFNGTLFGNMVDSVQKSTGGVFNQTGMGQYRYERYTTCRNENGNFFFPPLSVLLYGAASFLYKVFPGSSHQPDLSTMQSFFGADKSGDSWIFNGQEKLPDGWKTPSAPFTLVDVAYEIVGQYSLHPIEFGGNTGNGGFNLVNAPSLAQGKLIAPDAKTVSCLLYQTATASISSSLNSILEPVVDILGFALSKLEPGFENLGCPGPLN